MKFHNLHVYLIRRYYYLHFCVLDNNLIHLRDKINYLSCKVLFLFELPVK